MKTCELSRVPYWLTRSGQWQAGRASARRRLMQRALAAAVLGLLSGALAALIGL